MGRTIVEQRLQPLNTILGLLLPNEVNPGALSAAGYRLAGLEIPVATSPGKSVVIDLLLFHPLVSHLVAFESKSGANVEVDQALKYGTLDPQAVVQAAYVSLQARTRPTVEVAYLCQLEQLDRVRLGLDTLELKFPIVAVSNEAVRLDGEASSHLSAAFPEGVVRLNGPPPRLIPFDQDSDIQYIRPRVLAALVAAMAHRLSQISLVSLAEQATPHYALYGRAAQQQIRRKVTEAARQLAAEEHGLFEVVPPAGNREGLVMILKTPETNDTRGRTQAYQAIGRPGRARRRSQRLVPNPDQLDLLSELDAGDNEAEAPSATDEEVSDDDAS